MSSAPGSRIYRLSKTARARSNIRQFRCPPGPTKTERIGNRGLIATCVVICCVCEICVCLTAQSRLSAGHLARLDVQIVPLAAREPDRHKSNDAYHLIHLLLAQLPGDGPEDAGRMAPRAQPTKRLMPGKQGVSLPSGFRRSTMTARMPMPTFSPHGDDRDESARPRQEATVVVRTYLSAADT